MEVHGAELYKPWTRTSHCNRVPNPPSPLRQHGSRQPLYICTAFQIGKSSRRASHVASACYISSCQLTPINQICGRRILESRSTSSIGGLLSSGQKPTERRAGELSRASSR